MTTTELIAEVRRQLPPYYRAKISKKVLGLVVRTTFNVIRESLLNGELVRVEKFGTFRARAYQSRRSWSHTQQKLINSRPFMKIDFSMSRGMRDAAKSLLEKGK